MNSIVERKQLIEQAAQQLNKPVYVEDPRSKNVAPLQLKKGCLEYAAAFHSYSLSSSELSNFEFWRKCWRGKRRHCGRLYIVC